MHFNRFRVTAKYFDHVFTTDAGCIRQYLSGAGDRLKTAASLAFYAQPELHNILPSKRPYEHAVTYAGSYYGEKYPKRSVELSRLLTAAKDFGLAIYDRHSNPTVLTGSRLLSKDLYGAGSTTRTWWTHTKRTLSTST